MLSGIRQRQFNGVLNIPSFRRFWAGQVISHLGDVLGDIAFPLVVYQRTGSTVAMASMVIAAMLPNLLIGPWTGILADRFDRKPIMIGTDVVRALLVAGVPWFTGTWQFLVCWFLLSVMRQLFDQGRFGLIPGVVPPDKLLNANLLSQATSQVIGLAGPGVAGLLIAGIGTAPAFYIDALSFVLSALFLTRVVSPPRQPRPPFHLRKEIGEGWQVIRRSPALCFSATLVGAAMVGAMPINVLRVPFLVGTLKADAQAYGIALSAFSAAALLGTLFGGWLVKKFNRVDLILGGMVATATTAITYAVSPGLPFAIGSFAMLGFFNGLVNPINATLVQEQTPPNFHGRVLGWYTALATALSLVSSSVAGALGETIGVRQILVGASVFYLAGCISGYFLPWYRSARSLYHI